MDYYAVLQIAPTADQEIITAAYNQLKQKYEPLEDSTGEAHERMQAIREAYEVLGDPIRRKWYDRARTAEASQAAAQTAHVPAISPMPKRGTHWLWYLGFALFGVVFASGWIVYTLWSQSTDLSGATLAAVGRFFQYYAWGALILLFSVWLWVRSENYYARHRFWAWAVRILALIWIVNTLRSGYETTIRAAEEIGKLSAPAASTTTQTATPKPDSVPSSSNSSTEPPNAINWTVARNHANETRPVCGQVIATRFYPDQPQEPTALFFDIPTGTGYTFAVIIPKASLPNFSDSIEALYLYKQVCAFGLINSDGKSTWMWVNEPQYLKVIQ